MYPSKGDWASEVDKILKELKMYMDLNELKLIQKNKLAQIVKMAVENLAFTYLIAIEVSLVYTKSGEGEKRTSGESE